MTRVAGPPLERWKLLVVVGAPDECWPWSGSRNTDGYGRATVGSRTDGSQRSLGAHRWTWELHRGPIPEGMHVLHACDNPACCNPSHLHLGTHAENVKECLSRRRHRNFRRRSVCPSGHAIVGDNAYEYRGYVQCKMCRREASARLRERRRSAT